MDFSSFGNMGGANMDFTPPADSDDEGNYFIKWNEWFTQFVLELPELETEGDAQEETKESEESK